MIEAFKKRTIDYDKTMKLKQEELQDVFETKLALEREKKSMI